MAPNVRRRRPSRTVVASAVALALALVALPAPHAGAAESPTRRYRDRNTKFSFLIFPSWTQVPIESSSASGFSDVMEDCTVAKFAESKERGRESAEVRALRMGPGGAPAGARVSTGVTTGETTPGMDGEPGMGDGPGMGDAPPLPPGVPPEYAEALRRMNQKPKSMHELFDRVLDRVGSNQTLGKSKPKDIASKDKVPGRLWLLETSSDERQAGATGPGARKYFHAFAIWAKDGHETGLWMVCELGQRKKMEAHFRTIASSFTWFDPRAEDVEALPQLEGLAISARKRREIERTLVEGWDVVVSKKRNYVVVYNTKGRRNDQLARTVAERIEAIREQIYEVQFPPAKPVEAVSVARVCGDRREYVQYGGSPSSAGYWNSDAEELVLYDASPSKEIDDNTLAVLYHEAFHQYIYYSVGNVAPHSWFNEGHGDYYAGARWKAGKFQIGPFSWRTGVLRNALVAGPSPYEWDERKIGPETVRVRKWDRSKNGYSPLEALVTMDQGEYYAYPSVSYAQGWGLVYFLREIVPKNPKWAAKWGKILPTYFDTLKAEVNRDAPLTPVVPKKDDGGDDGPGKPEGGPEGGTPGMGDAPPMGEPTPGGPGMGDGPSPGMGDGPTPGMGDGPPADGGDEPDPSALGIPMGPRRGFGSDRALEAALKAAFQGVDFAELEAAWRESMSKTSG